MALVAPSRATDWRERPTLASFVPWALALLAYWAVYAGAFVLSYEIGWLAAIGSAAVTILPEAVMVPVVLTLSRRHAVDRMPRRRLVRFQLAGALAFLLLAIAWMLASSSVIYRVESGVWALRTTVSIVVWRAVFLMLVYATACSVAQAAAFARRARDEEQRAARAEALRTQAQLASLRAQLNPHFILNLLQSLLGLVSRDPQLAASALERLGDVLRYVLRVQQKADDEVGFGEEWRFVHDYLDLERLRLGDRLRVSLSADDEALLARLPAFLLQPLVENAVRHAVAPRASGGQVVVTARCAGGLLRLAVDDDGDGRHAVPTSGSGLGLALARERLAAIYGERASLRTGVSTLGGFVAEITLPWPASEDPA